MKEEYEMAQFQPVVLVTGASSGIGLATARAFASEGYEVFGTSRNIARLQPIPGIEYVELDVTEAASVRKAVASVIDRAGRIDILVNNAAVLLIGGAEESSVEQAQQFFDTNFFGVVRMANEVLPHMRTQGAGRIINVSSVVGFLPTPYAAFYTASKHALGGYSQSLDYETREFGIRVSLVEPGFTNTPIDSNMWMIDSPIDVYAARRAHAREQIAASTVGADEPEVVAAVIVKAASVPSPNLRYPAGRQARALSLITRFAPTALVDKAIRRVNNLTTPPKGSKFAHGVSRG